MDRTAIARRFMDALSSPTEASLASLAEVLAADVVSPKAKGRKRFLEAVRTAKGGPLFASGEWGEAHDDGEVVRATCTFAAGAPADHAVVYVRIDGDGLITEAIVDARLAPPGPFCDVVSRVWGPRLGLAELPRLLEERYAIEVSGTKRLDNGVLRIDRWDGDPWVVRVFPADRSMASVSGDAAVLRFLERNDYPAERCAHDEPVSTLAGQGVLVTEFVEGKKASAASKATWRKLGDALGRLHAMRGGSKTVRREAGALHLYTNGGSIRDELETAAASMDNVAALAKESPFASEFATVRKQLDVADDFGDLPRGLVHTDFVPKNVVQASGGELVPIDWALAGHGPRVASLGVLLLGATSKNGADRADAIAGGYREHVRLEPEELDRLADAMLHRQLVFECYGQCMGAATGQKQWGMGAWLDDGERCAEIAERARRAFAV